MNDRWRVWEVALHEAGHAVSAVALGGKCVGAVLYDDGGQAQIDELLGSREAYAIAAGPIAESLAKEYPVPSTPPADLRVLSVDEVETHPLFATSPFLCCQLARTADNRKPFPSDDQLIAQWAITGNESEPEAWAGRVEHVRRVAAGIVQSNAPAIVAVASALLAKGSLSGDEITALTEAA